MSSQQTVSDVRIKDPEKNAAELDSKKESSGIFSESEPAKPGSFNDNVRYKPSIGEWVGYICITVIVSIILIILLPFVVNYLKSDNYQAVKDCVFYCSKYCDNFPMGLTVGFLLSPIWLIVQGVFSKIKNKWG